MSFLTTTSPAGVSDVQGPASATDNAIVRYDGTTGKLLQNSGVIIDDSDNVTGVASLTVTTLVATTTVTTGDNIIVLNDDVTGAPSQNAGIEVERGTSTNASITWNETTDQWKAGLTGSEFPIVTSPNTVTDNAIVLFNGTTGEVNDSVVTIVSGDILGATSITCTGGVFLEDPGVGTNTLYLQHAAGGNTYSLAFPVVAPSTNQVLKFTTGGTSTWADYKAGDVVGPGSSTDNAIARYDSTTGKLLQNSAVIIDDSNNVTGVANLTMSGAFTHTGSTIGFFGATPVAQPTIYTTSGITIDRGVQGGLETLAGLTNVVGTLIQDLKALGLIG